MRKVNKNEQEAEGRDGEAGAGAREAGGHDRGDHRAMVIGWESQLI